MRAFRRILCQWDANAFETETGNTRGAALPGVDASRIKGTAHALNWQRAWRHAEDEALKP
jgi:hypothetical protein